MKVALCLHGLIGSKNDIWGRGKELDPKIAYNYYLKNFMKFNKNVDVFIHSQSYDFKNKFNKIYNPKIQLVERMKNFDFAIKEHYSSKRLFSKKLFLIDLIKFFFCFITPAKKRKIRINKLVNVYSMWYSRKKVIDLKKRYEKEKNFKYDMVFLSRLDLALLSPFRMSTFNRSKITLSKSNYFPKKLNNKLDKPSKKIVTDIGVRDFWFAGSSSNIDKFSLIYDKLNTYDINPHYAITQHCKKMGLKLDYKMYRWFDYELVRFKLYKSKI